MRDGGARDGETDGAGVGGDREGCDRSSKRCTHTHDATVKASERCRPKSAFCDTMV